MPNISSHAIVRNPANLADDVVVGAFAYIGSNVTIGPGTRVDNNAVLDGHVTIGDGNHVFPFAVIGQEGSAGRIVIGDRNQIREHAVICPGADASSPGTHIGSDSLIMIGCYVGADVLIRDHVVLGNYTQLADRTRVEQHVWASALTGTRTGTTIGAYTFTSGYAGIDRDAPPYAIVQGFPFKVRGVNTQNLKRCGFDEQTINDLKDAFRAVYGGSSDSPSAAALGQLAARDGLDQHVRRFVAFVQDRLDSPSADQSDTSAGQSATEGP
jgi:UDP-N-acetylglucosamine acyltransferase